MHTADLYQITDKEDTSFLKLIDLFTTATALPKSQEVRNLLADRCESLIKTSAESWGEEGILVNRSNAWKKSTVFQLLLDSATKQLKSGKASPDQASLDFDFGDMFTQADAWDVPRYLLHYIR